LAAPLMKKLHLELGGKDPFVIADDADPELAARALAYAALTNAGQVCTSTERVYIPKAKAMQLTEALVAHVQGIGNAPIRRLLSRGNTFPYTTFDNYFPWRSAWHTRPDW
jgi:betaine-aldehyde dehydrogenase